MTTEAALLAAIAAHPDEDTPRMVFADYLDGLDAVRVNCSCVSSGYPYGETCSMRCMKQGTILDTSNADRAGLIRLQVALAQRQPGDGYYDLSTQIDQLLTAHPEWKQLKCPAINHSDSAQCNTCHDSGCLFRYPVLTDSSLSQQSRNPTFKRGFLDSVDCRLEELGSEQVVYEDLGANTRHEFIPSAWAKALVTSPQCQMLTRLKITGRNPRLIDGNNACWFYAPGLVVDEWIPEWLLDGLSGGREGYQRWRIYPTRDAALDALAVAACSLVRSSPT